MEKNRGSAHGVPKHGSAIDIAWQNSEDAADTSTYRVIVLENFNSTEQEVVGVNDDETVFRAEFVAVAATGEGEEPPDDWTWPDNYPC